MKKNIKKIVKFIKTPVPIKELHEFLTVEGKEPIMEGYELRAVYA